MTPVWPPRPVRLDAEGHTAERFVERYKPWLAERALYSREDRSWFETRQRVETELLATLPRATWLMTEDDGKQSVWVVTHNHQTILFVVDMEGTVCTVLWPGSQPTNRRPVKGKQ